MSRKDFNILVNLGAGFYRSRFLKDVFDRLNRLGNVRRISDPKRFERSLAWCNAWIGWGSPLPTREMLENAPGLRWSGHLNLTLEGGLALLRHGVAVSEARHCWSPAVAEMALALMLAGLRKTSDYHAGMRRAAEVWPFHDFPSRLDPLQRQLTGRPVGIVGFGGIGRRLSELLKPFQTPLYVHDPFVPRDDIKAHGAKPAPLMKLMEASDVVVLCAANTYEARHLIGKREIAAMRRNAVLVNVGRAWLVDTEALVKRLKKGELIAMLDVFDKEPLAKSSPLRKLPNAYLTPHRAGGLVESVHRGLDMLVSDLEAFLDGRELAYPLDPRSAKIALASSRPAPKK